MEDKKLNVFISQPMANKTYDEIIDVRKRVVRKVREYFGTKELTFLSSCFITSDFDMEKDEK